MKKKTVLEKAMEDALNKLSEKDHKESSLVYIGRDANGNKRYTSNRPQKVRDKNGKRI